MILTWILCSAVAGAIAIASALVVYAIIHRKARSQPEEPKCLHCDKLQYVMSNGFYECKVFNPQPLSKAPVYCKDYIEREANDG